MPVHACEPLSQSTRHLHQSFLCVGRELLELKRGDKLKEFGCNNIGQYAECKHGIPEREARAMARLAEALETLPALARAAEDGTLSFYELRLLTRYATPESDQHCVRLASEFTVGQLSRVLRDLAGALDSKKSREVLVHWKLDSETLVMFEHALRKLSEQSQRRLDTNEGLQRMAALVLTGKSDDEAVESCREYAALDILADEARRRATLADLPDEITYEAPEVQLTKVGDVAPWENNLLRFNPNSRMLTPAQRTEIMRRDCYCCATPGCHNTLWLQVHHIEYWYRGGRTVWGNLVVLCSKCHRLIHERWLVLRGTAPDGLEFLDRWGRRLRCRGPDG
jgi:hypothetical protein